MTDPLDRILKHHAAATLTDDGFGARVMSALPMRQTRSRPWLRPALVIGSTALGAALAFMLSPAAGSLLEGFVELAQLRMFSPAAVSAVAITCALLVSAVILAVDTD
jgi:hypothetical protein